MNRTLLLKPLAVITAVLFLSGCGAANHHSEGGSYKASQAVRAAYSQIGTKYKSGGASPSQGFDCSGLVRWTYKSVGINLPRTAREQSLMGYRIMDVSKMRAGDIVAFRRSGGGYHTGIYIGDGKVMDSIYSGLRTISLSDWVSQNGRGWVVCGYPWDWR